MKRIKTNLFRSFLGAVASILMMGCMTDVSADRTEENPPVDAVLIPEEGMPDIALERLRATEQARYQLWTEELDSFLAALETSRESGESLKGGFSPLYLSKTADFYKDFQGYMTAIINKGEITGLQIDTTTEKDQQHFEYYIFDESIYIRYQMSDDREENFPVYINCANTLRYFYQFEGAEVQIPSIKDMNTKQYELLYKEGKLYRIIRSENRIAESGEWTDFSIYEWLTNEVVPEVRAEIKNSKWMPEDLTSIIPDGYSALSIFAAGDLNGDGEDDLLLCLYPSDPADFEPRDYDKDDVYRHIPEYENASFWIFTGNHAGGYDVSEGCKIDRYPLTLVDINIHKGGFELEYFIGRSPWENTVLRFRYDPVRKDYYLAEMVERLWECTEIISHESFNEKWFLRDEDLFMNPPDNHLDSQGDQWNEMFLHYWNNENPVKEKEINELIWENKSQLVAAIRQIDPNLDVPLFREQIYYQNSRTLSYRYEIHDSTYGNPFMPFLIDLDKRERLCVKDMLSYEEVMALLQGTFLEFSNNDQEALASYLDSEEVMRDLWDSLDSIERMADPSGRFMGAALMAEGMVFIIYDGEKENPWPFSILVGKEQFRNTAVYQFWE